MGIPASVYDFLPSHQSKLVEIPKSCQLVKTADLLVACCCRKEEVVLAFELFFMALYREIGCQYRCFLFVMQTINLYVSTEGVLVERTMFFPVQE